MGFRPPVHFAPADFTLRRPALHGDLQAMFGQGATGAFHGADTDPQGADDLRVLHGPSRMILIRCQQDLRPQAFGRGGFAGGHQGFEFQPFGFRQVNAVFFRHSP